MADVTDPLAGALDFLQALDEGHDNKFNELARQLTNNLFILLRSAGMHALTNDAMNRPIEHMIATVNEFIEHFNEEVALQLVDDNFFVNKRLVRLDFGTFQNTRYLRRIFQYVAINELTFTQPVDRGTLMNFLKAFLSVVRMGQGKMVEFPLGTIRVRNLEVTTEDEGQGETDPRNRILLLYASGLIMLRQFVNDLRQGKSPRHARVKRLCLELIDVEPRFHNLLLGLMHLEAYKGNLFSHMLNTAVLSVVFGQRLGMTRNQLVDLGMAAFHHDLGWAMVGALGEAGGDVEELSMDGVQQRLTSSVEEMDELRLNVARALVRLGGFNESVINRLIVAYECQIPDDAAATGLYYGPIGPAFMTNVVRMASMYDELTTGRPGRPALPPDQVMRRILDDGGKTFDVFTAKLFGNCIGAYPVGTVVELDTSEVALVVNLPTNPVNFHRPQVKVLRDNVGQAMDTAGPIVDLNDTYRGGGKYMRTIERTLPHEAFDINVTRFFFG